MNAIRCALAACAALLFFAITPTVTLAGDDDSYQMSQSEVYQVQTILIENGWALGFFFLPDGDFGDKTRQAIGKLQAAWKVPVTGILTTAQFNTIIAWPPSNLTWGAISVANDKAYGAVWNAHSGIEAYKQAAQKCNSRTTDPYGCATTAGYTSENETLWFAGATCTATNEYNVAAAGGTTRNEATQAAFKAEADKGFDRSDCSIFVTMTTTSGPE